MRIGELSAKAGVNVQTVRFYEREKLLRRTVRTASGYRTFTEADLERVRFIKDSQQLGFSLKEIKELLEIHEAAKSFARRDDPDRLPLKTQVNENAKQMCFWSELPEMDHNEIVGWEGAPAQGQFSAVFLDDSDAHPRLKERMGLASA